MNKSRLKLIPIFGMMILLWIPLRSTVQKQAPTNSQTFDPAPDWRPTHAAPNARYAGNAACAECHDETATQPATPMGRSLETAAESRILQEHPQLTFKTGPHSYSIVRRGNQSIYTVTDGKDSLSLPILYAFGQGKVGQTYVIRHEGKYYESRVSFYGAIGELDFTLGASRAVPGSLAEAIGRVQDSAAINDCFSCHATAAVSRKELQLDRMTPGITCEGCHGAGEKHVVTMKSRGEAGRRPGNAKAVLTEKYILNPGRFDTEGLTQFCGACHRSWIQVQILGIRGVENVRFQPYRIFNSKCYDHQDKRISCTACHDPHAEIEMDAAYYDAKCVACHQPDGKSEQKSSKSARNARVCPTAKQDCASCHMPKTELPGAHFKFTDHQIRIVRAGAPYPN